MFRIKNKFPPVFGVISSAKFEIDLIFDFWKNPSSKNCYLLGLTISIPVKPIIILGKNLFLVFIEHNCSHCFSSLLNDASWMVVTPNESNFSFKILMLLLNSLSLIWGTRVAKKSFISNRIPLGSPVSVYRSIRPPDGSGVYLEIPTFFKARLFKTWA